MIVKKIGFDATILITFVDGKTTFHYISYCNLAKKQLIELNVRSLSTRIT